MLQQLRMPLLLIVGLAAVAGCGDGGPRVVPVTGTVTRNNKPVPNLHINFAPEAEGQTGRPSWGRSDEQGQFILEYDPERKGAEIGKHKVFVSFRAANPKEEISGRMKSHPDKAAIEAKYGKRESTPLEVEIRTSGQHVTLQLD